MKVLVTGATGQLGTDLMTELHKREINAVGIGSKDCDITNMSEVRKCISKYEPTVIIHCACYTAVDKAEEETEKCILVNATGTENIVKVCKENNIELMYISTDYVFDGKGTIPWKTNAIRNPQSVYGKSKYMGEIAVQNNLTNYYIVRISWIYGLHGKNFVKAILKKAETSNEILVVNDQIGTPTYTVDIAKAITDIIRSRKFGIYHVSNEGYCSWFEFAKKVFEKMDKEVNVVPISSDEYPAKADRPKNSRLDKSEYINNGFEPLPNWENALERFIAEYKSL